MGEGTFFILVLLHLYVCFTCICQASKLLTSCRSHPLPCLKFLPLVELFYRTACDTLWHFIYATLSIYIYIYIYMEGSPSLTSHSKFLGLFTYSYLLFTHERKAVLKNENGGIVGQKLKLALHVSDKILRYKCSQGREKYYSMHGSFLSLASSGRVLKTAVCSARYWLHT